MLAALTQMAVGLEDQGGRPPVVGTLVLGCWMEPLSPDGGPGLLHQKAQCGKIMKAAAETSRKA